jgi:hypothetical protein
MEMIGKAYLLPMLTIIAAFAGLVGLAPLAFSMQGISIPLFPLGNAVFFVVMLGGPVLLLASGLRVFAANVSTLSFLGAFMGLVITCGLLPPLSLQRHGLVVDWMAMVLITLLVAAGLRRSWLWGVVGGAWQAILLASFAVGSIQSAFFSPSASGFAKLTLIWVIGFLLAFISSVIAFRGRSTPELVSAR